MQRQYNYEDLVRIIEVLRSDKGCPWDKVQTHQTLVPNLLEECYELIEALQGSEYELMKEELGDVLLQVVMHAQIAKEEEAFTMEEVIEGICLKLITRHPHVFNEENGGAITVEQVSQNWEEIKKKEKKEKTLYDSLERVAKTLPSLVRAQKVQKKVVKQYGENQQKEALIQEINGSIETLELLKDKVLYGKNDYNDEEIGEILRSIVNISTFFDINAEFALTKSLEKFINRFRYIENSTFTQS